MKILMFIIFGFLSGTIGSMGLGGGTVLIPLLVIFAGFDQRVAQASNLIAFIPAAIIAFIKYNKKNPYDFKSLRILWIYGIIGALLGLLLAFSLSSDWLRKGFGIFLLVLGVYQLILQEKNNKNN